MSSNTTESPITVALDPDPRGVSVGVWQGSHCIYTGAHAVPATVAPGDAQDERQAFERWLDRRGVWPALCHEEVFIAGWNARPADAPAAGDARAITLPAKMPKHEGNGSEYPSSESYHEGYAEGWNDAIDAAIAAQQGKGSEA